MKITSLEEYGLRCMLRLARQPEGESLTVAEIAEAEGLTVPHVGKLMTALRQARLVESVRGRSGGYILIRRPEAISVAEVMGALGEPLFATSYCEQHPGTLQVCTHQGDCSIRSVWQRLGEMIQSVLTGISLADLRRDEAGIALHLESRRTGLLTLDVPAALRMSDDAPADPHPTLPGRTT
jgi:Rrf2 family protein